VHTRDTLKTTATQALGTDVYGTIVQHLVETSAIMRAGATVITTDTGEDLVVPKSTGFVSTAIIGEGASITESDPTLATVTLKAFKYANYFEVSQELANDSPTNLLDFLARQAALSLGLGSTGYGDDLIKKSFAQQVDRQFHRPRPQCRRQENNSAGSRRTRATPCWAVVGVANVTSR
jgi:predicted phage gp36 major capsid-like protein